MFAPNIGIKFETHTNTNFDKEITGGKIMMKATGIVRRIDDLGRVVIPKEIRRTMRIREGDPLLMSLSSFERYVLAMVGVEEWCKNT